MRFESLSEFHRHANLGSMNALRNLSFASIICVVCGCTSTTSENVTTQGISADIDVQADGSGRTFVTVKLEVGNGGVGGTSLQLSSGDSLTARANGIQQTLTEDSSIFGEFSYVTNFNFDDANTVFTVSLVRNNGVSAPNSTVALPDGFVISSPTPNNVFGTNDVVPVIWSPSGTSIVPDAFVTLTCTLTSGLTSVGARSVNVGSDSGTVNVSVSSVMPPGAIDTSRLCEGVIELSRFRVGSLDPNYGAGGRIDAEQVQTGQFFVNPAIN